MRYGLVSGKAVSKVKPGYGGNYPDTGTGPVGAVSSDHINAAAQQKAGRGFSNAERDGNPDTGADAIDAARNRRDYYGKVKGKNPFTKRSWQPEWFDSSPMTKLGDRTSDPASDVGGPSGMDHWGATGTSWRDRARRGET
jgi:hypothetical protein